MLLWNRIVAALTTVPGLSDWGQTAGILVAYGVIALLIGSSTRFLQWNVPIKNWLQVSLQALFAPAIIEEVGFRILLLPHPSEGVSMGTWWLWGGLSLVLFLLYHPLNALTLYKAGYPTFLNSTFLVLATLLGIACTLAYGLTASLWPPVLIHWVVVVIWLCWLGGVEHLTPQEAPTVNE